MKVTTLNRTRFGRGRSSQTLCCLAALATLGMCATTACGAEGTGADANWLVYPIPVSPLWKNATANKSNDEDAEREAKRAAYDRTPVLPPKPSGDPTVPVEPPARKEIVRALQEIDTSLAGQSLEDLDARVRHFDVRRISQTVDPPRIMPLVGLVRVSHIGYKCTVCLQQADKDSKATADRESFETQVVFIHNTHLHMVNEVEGKDGNDE